MAKEYGFTFTVTQIEALIKALEESGINSGSYQSALERFRDPQLVAAAKSAHGLLRGAGQRQAKPTQTTIAKELEKDTSAGDPREALQRLRSEHAGMLSEIEGLLTAVVRLRQVLKNKLATQLDDAARAALHDLDNELDTIRMGDGGLAQKLGAVEV
jgi:hypothetical protein